MNSKPINFDLVRISKSKQEVDICSNTIRAYHEEGLPFYKNGKAVFFSKIELDQFIREKAVKDPIKSTPFATSIVYIWTPTGYEKEKTHK